MKKAISIIIVALSLFLIGCPSKPVDETPVMEQKPLVVFLVRHAEKVDAGKDPELSKEGKKRTEDLAEILRSANIDHVHSTDYIRTRDTATPLAKANGVEVEKYNPDDLDGFAEDLKKAGGRHLVVGHSNTTPKSPHSDILKASTYNDSFAHSPWGHKDVAAYSP